MSTYNKGHKFELKTAQMFRDQGYKVKVTKASGDYGIDIILQKDGDRYGVECKAFRNGNNVGRPIVQKFDSALNHNPYSKTPFRYGYIVTTSEFSAEAIEATKYINSHHGYERININKMKSRGYRVQIYSYSDGIKIFYAIYIR
jgi:HJR/Mrr/RecB family endonuclease